MLKQNLLSKLCRVCGKIRWAAGRTRVTMRLRKMQASREAAKQGKHKQLPAVYA